MVYYNGNSDNLLLVLITPEDYDDFLKFLGNNGFKYKSGNIVGDKSSILEQTYDYKYSTIYAIDVEDKIVVYFPLEIYQRNSPTSDDNKYKFYYSQLLSCDKVERRILNEN